LDRILGGATGATAKALIKAVPNNLINVISRLKIDIELDVFFFSKEDMREYRKLSPDE
jgi:hypothetical protein